MDTVGTENASIGTQPTWIHGVMKGYVGCSVWHVVWKAWCTEHAQVSGRKRGWEGSRASMCCVKGIQMATWRCREWHNQICGCEREKHENDFMGPRDPCNLFFKNNFMYLFLVGLGVCCWPGFPLVGASRGLLSGCSACALIAVAFLVVEHGL